MRFGRSDRTYRRTYRWTHRWSPRGHTAGHATDTSPDASVDTVRPHPPITLKYLYVRTAKSCGQVVEQDRISSVTWSVIRCGVPGSAKNARTDGGKLVWKLRVSRQVEWNVRTHPAGWSGVRRRTGLSDHRVSLTCQLRSANVALTAAGPPPIPKGVDSSSLPCLRATE